MNKEDVYRAKAAEAQRWADRVVSPDDKAKWLRVVEGWMSLIRQPNLKAVQRFDDQVQSAGTRQEDSKGSH